MRHFTLASLAATALTFGLLTATPVMAQATQPAAKSDSKMAPAPKAPATESKMAPAAAAQSPGHRTEDAPPRRSQGRTARHQFGDRRSARRASRGRQGLFGQDH